MFELLFRSFYSNVLLFEYHLLWLLSHRNKTFTSVLFMITFFNWQNQFDSFINSAFSYQKCLMKSMLFFRGIISSQCFVKNDQKLWHDYRNFRAFSYHLITFFHRLFVYFFRYFCKNIYRSWKFWYRPIPGLYPVANVAQNFVVISVIELFSKF